MALILVALVWGFSEATFFFIVPDVLLSWVALTQLRKALQLSLYATIGAVLGGMLIYYGGIFYFHQVHLFFICLPGIHDTLIRDVSLQMDQRGWMSLFVGAFTGVPYKLYAVQSAFHGISGWKFFLISIPVRGFRFILVTLLTGLISQLFLTSWTPMGKRLLHAAFWVTFYAIYFKLMS